MTKEEFVFLFEEFCIYYGKKGLSKNNLAIQAWSDLLRVCPTIPDLQSLFVTAIREYRWFPSPSEVLALSTKGNELQAIEEWTKLVHSLESGSRQTFSPPAEKAIASLGGRVHLSSLSLAQLFQQVESRFIARYIQYSRALNNGSIQPDVYLAASVDDDQLVQDDPPMSDEMRSQMMANINAFLMSKTK